MTFTRVEDPEETSGVEGADLSLIAQLLHAMNQPLTGLQCSLELALSLPGSLQQYADCMHSALRLTERMRNLMGTIHALLEIEGAKNNARERIELKTVLCQALDELRPVADAKGVSLSLEGSSVPVTAGRNELTSAMFRVLESTISLAAPGTLLSIACGMNAGSACARISWAKQQSSPLCAEAFSPELGLVLAQAGFRRAGVDWTREQFELSEMVVLRAPLFSDKSASIHTQGENIASITSRTCERASDEMRLVAHE